MRSVERVTFGLLPERDLSRVTSSGAPSDLEEIGDHQLLLRDGEVVGGVRELLDAVDLRAVPLEDLLGQ
jgi:hypothetical protein